MNPPPGAPPPAPPASTQGDTMQMHEAEELKEADSLSEAQRALDEGWKLIAVVAGNGTGDALVPLYVLGRKKEKAPMKINPDLLRRMSE